MSSAITMEVAVSLLQVYLSGFRGYPRDEKGERTFGRCLQDCCVSVGHAEEVLRTFDLEFPTVREIVTAANDTRQKFEPQVSRHEEWRKQYGEPVPMSVTPSDKMACHWQAIRDVLYYTEGPGASDLARIVGRAERRNSEEYWQSALAYNLRHHRETLDFVRMQAQRFGWSDLMDRAASPEPFPYESPMDRERREKVKRPVTPQDIEEAKAAVATVATEGDGWEDPDR